MSFSVRRVTETKKKRRFPWAKLPLLLSVLRPLAGWYRGWKQRREEEEHALRRTLLLKRGLLILIAILCALGLLAGTVKALVQLKVITMRSLFSMTGTTLPRDGNGFTNILLLGQGDENHDGKDLTDTIIVASIDPGKTKSAVLLSLPRDLYILKSEKMGKGRINSLYRDYKILLKRQGMNDKEASLEAMKELGKAIGDHLDLEVHHVIKADFTGFEKAIDAIGGVDVVVPEDINDAEYPDMNYGYEPFAISAGPAHLDGAIALKYVRSRHGTSDFGRSARQQQVITAIGEKVKSQGLYKDAAMISDLFKVFADHVWMTMTTRELIGLADLTKDITPARVISVQLNDRNGLFSAVAEPGGFLYTPPRDQFEGASVLLPISIPEFPVTWKQIETFSHLLFAQRQIFLAKPSIAILNAKAKSGLGRKLADELIRYGFDVQKIENLNVPKSVLKASNNGTYVYAQSGDSAPLASFFADLLREPVVTIPVPAIPPDQLRQVTIVLDKDYVYRPIQNLLTTQ